MSKQERLERGLARSRRVATVMDDLIRVPGTRFRFGIDPLLGFIPYLGDTASAVWSGYLIFIALRCGAPFSVIARMIANIGIDMLLGTVPALGDALDFVFKANVRNHEILERYAAAPDTTARSSSFFLGAFCAVSLLIFLGVSHLCWFALRALAGLLGMPVW